jgi:FdhE protein
MAGGFIHRFFGPAPDRLEVVSEVLALRKLAGDRPQLAGPAALLAEVLPPVYRGSLRDTAPPLTAEQARTKLAGGVPLLRGEPFTPDARSFRRRWLSVCGTVQQHQGSDAARHLADALRRGRLDPGELTRDLLAGRPEAIYARAAALDLDAGLTATVLRLTLFRVLSAVAADLAPLREGVPWQEGCCPTCGSGPLLGEFRGLEQTRFLRCGLCATGWEFPRLRCPFCGNHRHERLVYFHVEGEEGRYRVAACEDCRRYVKMVSTLSALTAPGLLVEELATLHLDLVAAERGFGIES